MVDSQPRPLKVTRQALALSSFPGFLLLVYFLFSLFFIFLVVYFYLFCYLNYFEYVFHNSFYGFENLIDFLS